MKTEKELNSDILKITMNIAEKYPELSKYIAEMSDTIPVADSPYDSLHAFIRNYAFNHDNATK